MKSFAVVSYRVRGLQNVQTNRFDLTNPEGRIAWEVFVDSIRAQTIGEGADAYIRPGACDYFVTSFELAL